MSYLLENDLSTALEKQRENVRQASYSVAHRLSAESNSAYYLASGMASYISIKPDLTHQEFAKLAAGIISSKDVFRNIAGAPNLVINNIYPVEGNEKTLGLNYQKMPDQFEGIQKAIESKSVMFTGPIKLVQGGEGFIARFPIYYLEDEREKFWGILSTVIDSNKLYELAGLTQPDLPIIVALHDEHDTDEYNRVNFFGSVNLNDFNPISIPVKIPGGEWMLTAIPKNGWLTTPPNRLIIVGFSSLALGLYFLASLLLQMYINRLANSRALADAANTMKSRFIANMSHEMRTPLNGIMGYTSLLEQSDLNAKQTTLTENLSLSTKALLAISNDILDLAKLETGQLVLNIHSFILKDIINEAINLNINMANQKNLNINTKFGPSCDALTITTDGNRLRQIISNLIDNAVKFTKEGGITIEVKKSDTDDTVVIAVIDTGIGINQIHITRIFERFEQVEDIYSRNHIGAGLGLSICRELVQVLDGKLEIESAVDMGTSAIVTLPIHNKQTLSDSI